MRNVLLGPGKIGLDKNVMVTILTDGILNCLNEFKSLQFEQLLNGLLHS